AVHRAAPAGPRKRSFGRWFSDTGWRHLVAVVVAVFAVFPLLFVLSSALNPNGTLTGSNALFSRFGSDSFWRILSGEQGPYLLWFWNTIKLAVVTAVASTLMGALAAYAFSRMRFTGRRFGLVTIVVIQMFPQLLGAVAIFLMMNAIGDVFPAFGLNTH